MRVQALEPEPFFKLRTIPGNAWPPLPDGTVTQLWLAYQGLERSQWLEPEAIVQGQLEQVRLLLTHCVQHVPYYRDLLAQAGLVPQDIRSLEDFRRIPVLQRQSYQQHLADLEARSLPGGTVATSINRTSGTTGVPVNVLQTNMTHIWWLAYYMRDIQWCGFNPRGNLASLRTVYGLTPEQEKEFLEGWSSSTWNPQLDKLFESGKAHSMDLHQDAQRQLDWLRRIAPDYLQSYPSNLDFLGGLLRERGERLPSIKVIQTFAENLAPEVEKRIAEAFGVPVKNLYSCCEAGYVASPCPDGEGLHVHAENVILEVLDDKDQPCAPGQTGRIVLTTLHNFRGPFIRYEILDEATVGERCPCGRGLPLLKRVWGKRRPLFRLPDGRVKSSVQLVADLHQFEEVRQHQIVQKAVDHVLVRVVPNPGWSEAHAEQIRKAFEAFFEAPIRTEVQVVERLELPASGKLVAVMSEVPLTGSVPATAAVSPAASATASKVSTASTPVMEKSPPQPALTQAARPAASTRPGKTVLVGWELGKGFGHVEPLLRVAKELAAKGHRVVFAVKELANSWALLRGESFPVLQAPLWSRPPDVGPGPFVAATYADILAVHGYTDVEDLMPMVQGWQGLLDLVQPSMVLCDHSPTLCLAAFGTLPVVLLGNGFTMPPSELATLPVLVPKAVPITPQEQLLAVVQEVQRRRRRPVPERLPQAVAGTARFVTAFPELDPYQASRREPCIGPLHARVEPMPLPPQPRFFAYLNAEMANLEVVLDNLAQAKIPGGAYLRGASANLRRRLRRPGLDILDEPMPITRVLPQVSAVVHHAGGGLAQYSLAAGRPQLLFPQHLEQMLSAQQLHRLGVAHYLVAEYPAQDIPTGLHQLVTEKSFTERAQTIARGIQSRGPWDPLPKIVERCLAILA